MGGWGLLPCNVSQFPGALFKTTKVIKAWLAAPKYQIQANKIFYRTTVVTEFTRISYSLDTCEIINMYYIQLNALYRKHLRHSEFLESPEREYH